VYGVEEAGGRSRKKERLKSRQQHCRVTSSMIRRVVTALVGRRVAGAGGEVIRDAAA
jgi:hypothetical protein